MVIQMQRVGCKNSACMTSTRYPKSWVSLCHVRTVPQQIFSETRCSSLCFFGLSILRRVQAAGMRWQQQCSPGWMRPEHILSSGSGGGTINASLHRGLSFYNRNACVFLHWLTCIAILVTWSQSGIEPCQVQQSLWRTSQWKLLLTLRSGRRRALVVQFVQNSMQETLVPVVD